MKFRTKGHLLRALQAFALALVMGFSTIAFSPTAAQAVSGSEIAADGTYTSTVRADKYKKGKYDKSYYGQIHVSVADGKITGLSITAEKDKLKKLLTAEIRSTYIGQDATVDAVSGVDVVTSASVADVDTTTSATQKSYTTEKYYVSNVKQAIADALATAPARSDAGSGTAEETTYIGTATDTNKDGSHTYTLKLNVTVKDGTITGLSVADGTTGSWDSLVSSEASKYIGKSVEQIDAVDVVTSASTPVYGGYSNVIKAAVKNALAQVSGTGDSGTPAGGGDAGETTSVQVTKQWSDGADAHAGETVTAAVCGSQNTVVRTVTLNRQNNWTAAADGLPAADTYTVREQKVTDAGGKDVTAQYTAEVTEKTETGTSSGQWKKTDAVHAGGTYAMTYTYSGKEYLLGANNGQVLRAYNPPDLTDGVITSEVSDQFQWTFEDTQDTDYPTSKGYYHMKNNGGYSNCYLYAMDEQYGGYFAMNSEPDSLWVQSAGDFHYLRGYFSYSRGWDYLSNGTFSSAKSNKASNVKYAAHITFYERTAGDDAVTAYTITNTKKAEEPAAAGGIKVSKQVDKSSGKVGDSFALTMDAYATAAEVKTTTSSGSAAIVLALDLSGSMDSQKISRLNTAVNNLLKSLPAGQKIKVVTFGSTADYYGEMGSGDTAAFRQISGDALTNFSAALTKAYDQIKNATEESKNIILFSDGQPEDSSSAHDTAWVNAIRTAQQVKNNNVSIYTVSVASSADAAAPVAGAGQSFGEFFASSTDIVNNVMQLVSSNYSGVSVTGSGYGSVTVDAAEKQDSKYYVANTTSDWSGLFTGITQEIISYSTVSLDASSVMKDQVNTDYFDVSGITATAKAWSYDPSAGTWTETADTYTPSVDQSTGLVTVTGFDYAKHWVSEDGTQTAPDGGQKLVLTISGLKAKDASAGKTVDTNKAPQGVYENGGAAEPAAAFTSPQVTVEQKKTFTVYHQSDKSTETFDLTDSFDVTETVKAGCLYGGLYTDDTFTTPVTDICGKAFRPEADKTYYVKEVSTNYLNPKIYSVYNKKQNNKLKFVYLVTAIDDTNYRQVGFDIDSGAAKKEQEVKGDATVYQSFVVDNSADDSYSKGASATYSLTKFFPKLTTGYLNVQKYNSEAYTGLEPNTAFTMVPYYVTMDGVKVTGTVSRHVDTRNGTGIKASGGILATDTTVESVCTKETAAAAAGARRRLTVRKAYTAGSEETVTEQKTEQTNADQSPDTQTKAGGSTAGSQPQTGDKPAAKTKSGGLLSAIAALLSRILRLWR